MRDVVLDANVIVGWLDDNDVLAPRSAELIQRLRVKGIRPVLLDICVSEAISVICRRGRERKVDPPDLTRALSVIRSVADRGELRYVAKESEHLMSMILGIIETTGGVLNFNDALLVALQRVGLIEEVASFDQGLDKAQGFRRLW